MAQPQPEAAIPSVCHGVVRIVVVAVSLAVATSAGAQSAGDGATNRTCLATRPAPACRFIVIYSVNAFGQLGSTFRYRPNTLDPDGPPFRNRLLGAHATIGVGLLRNLDERRGIGGLVETGWFQEGHRVAVRGRYRHWLSDHVALDVSPGLLRAEVHDGPEDVHTWRYGATTDVDFRYHSWALALRNEVLFTHSEGAVPAFYAGVKADGVAGLVTTIGTAVAFVVLVSIAFSGAST